MEEVIDEIVAYAKKKVQDFSLCDQAQIYEELCNQMNDLNYAAMKDEYLADGLYC